MVKPKNQNNAFMKKRGTDYSSIPSIGNTQMVILENNLEPNIKFW